MNARCPSAHLTVGVLTCVASLVLLSAAEPQELEQQMRVDGGTITFHVDQSRPLSVAVGELEKVCKCVITYEDPQFVHESEGLDRTVVPVDGRRFITPRGGELRFEYYSAAGQLDDVRLILRDLLRQYAVAKLPGAFGLLEHGGVLHVVPRGARDRSGTAQPAESILNARVSLPSVQQSVSRAVERVLSAVSQHVGRRVAPGILPRWFQTTNTDVSAKNETARSLLRRILARADESLSWQLMYDPSFGMYVLNIHRVETYVK